MLPHPVENHDLPSKALHLCSKLALPTPTDLLMLTHCIPQSSMDVLSIFLDNLGNERLRLPKFQWVSCVHPKPDISHSYHVSSLSYTHTLSLELMATDVRNVLGFEK